MDQLPLLKVFKMGTPGAPWELKLAIRSASILALASRPKILEAPHSRAAVPHSNLFETIGTIFAEFPPRRRANEFAAGSSRIDVI
jgi:hypothetical protein